MRKRLQRMCIVLCAVVLLGRMPAQLAAWTTDEPVIEVTASSETPAGTTTSAQKPQAEMASAPEPTDTPEPTRTTEAMNNTPSVRLSADEAETGGERAAEDSGKPANPSPNATEPADTTNQTSEGDPPGQDASDPLPTATGTPTPTPTPEPTPTPTPTPEPETTDALAGTPEPGNPEAPEGSGDSEGTSTPGEDAAPKGTDEPEPSPTPEATEIPEEISEGEEDQQPEDNDNPGDGEIVRVARRDYTDWRGVVPSDERGMPIPILYQGDYGRTICVIGGRARSVATSGCGATSMSMVIAYLTGNTEQSPYSLFYEAFDAGRYHGSGLSNETLTWLGERYGVLTKWINNDPDAILEALQSGKPVVAHMGEGIFTSQGHYIVLRGVTEDGKILVNDPASAYRTGLAYPVETLVKQARTGHAFMVCWSEEMPEASEAPETPEETSPAQPVLTVVPGRTVVPARTPKPGNQPAATRTARPTATPSATPTATPTPSPTPASTAQPPAGWTTGARTTVRSASGGTDSAAGTERPEADASTGANAAAGSAPEAAGAASEMNAFAGTWRGTLLGAPVTVTLNADGTYAVALEEPGEDATPGEWDVRDGSIVVGAENGDAASLDYDGEYLTAPEGLLLTLARADETPTPSAAPTPTAAATATTRPTATATVRPAVTTTVRPAVTARPTATATSTPTATVTVEPTATPVVTPTATPTPEPAATPEPTPQPAPTAEDEAEIQARLDAEVARPFLPIWFFGRR